MKKVLIVCLLLVGCQSQEEKIQRIADDYYKADAHRVVEINSIGTLTQKKVEIRKNNLIMEVIETRANLINSAKEMVEQYWKRGNKAKTKEMEDLVYKEQDNLRYYHDKWKLAQKYVKEADSVKPICYAVNLTIMEDGKSRQDFILVTLDYKLKSKEILKLDFKIK